MSGALKLEKGKGKEVRNGTPNSSRIGRREYRYCNHTYVFLGERMVHKTGDEPSGGWRPLPGGVRVCQCTAIARSKAMARREDNHHREYDTEPVQNY